MDRRSRTGHTRGSHRWPNLASGIKNAPNDWFKEPPRYIVDLLKRVSLDTMNIVNGLPALNERK